jgi:GWxTD domain-containing protein
MKTSGYIAIAASGILILLGCARSINPQVNRGAGYQYQIGYPEVRLTLLQSLDREDTSSLEIVADIVYASLFFKKQDEKFQARLAVELEVRETEKDQIIESRRFSYNQTVGTYQRTKSQDTFSFRESMEVEPGEYEVTFSLIDQNSGKRTTRVDQASVQDDSTTHSTNVRLFGKKMGEHNNEWFPLTTYDIPSRIDSLNFIHLVNNTEEQNLTVVTKLYKYQSDTTAAKSIYKNNYSPSSISYKGIDYGERTELHTNRRILSRNTGVTIETKFGMLERGNYRFEIRSADSENEIFRARDFSIKSANYPTVKTPSELARPLTYLMSDSEYEELLFIEDSNKLKQAVDKFWLRNIGNKSEAKTVISLYYERVEEANKLFSNFKEGWKTDRGMIYILFGRPVSEQRIRNSITWSYTYNLNNPDYNFTFERNRLKTEYFPFDYFILNRNFSYYQVEYQQKQLWLNGLIIIRKI